jgi:hypothetical protein
VAELKAQIDTNAEEAEQSQWGFLKNIINIDRFFDSGTDAAGNSRA